MRAHNKDKTKMSTSDHQSHKEEKDPSAMNKQSENEGEKKAGHSSTDQITDGVTKLSIEEPTAPSDRDKIRVKFLINVPVGVTPEMSGRPESHCQTFLDLLRRTAFKPEDERRYEDIAVVFGLNGNESDKGAIDTEFDKQITSKIAFRKFCFPWPGNDIPYRKIRETIKNHEHTREFVKLFRTDNLECIIYFCFFDADTVHFNHVLSSYIDVIHEHKYPTVMSTGYVFPKDSENRERSERDRQVRIKTAEHFPLGTYYPEPNFCVFLPLGEHTLPEKFDCSERDSNNNMESPNLITQVKNRCKAVFADKNPVVTSDSKKNQFHTNPRTWATSAYAHKELKLTEEYIQEIKEKKRKEKETKEEKPKEEKPKEKPKEEKPKEDVPNDGRARNMAHIPLLTDLLKDDTITETQNRRHFKRPGADQVFKAARAVRDLIEQ
ncbi:uncharacterized protein LOC130554194 [Triplophysa rosa]|uniref:Uncharacterized protein n=1 Tax=Triplophysa rosa TaxID=992332 RepID=A0A9W7WX62_TRIRA|nr:uncharacterized protein LOC130554194 [Triplophysa rosa]KAI7810302.1 hypothetical protein IRJ41_023972 [Triplophysa rosa]